MVLDRWSRAKDGEGQVVLLAGEPATDKTGPVAVVGGKDRKDTEP